MYKKYCNQIILKEIVKVMKGDFSKNLKLINDKELKGY